MLIARFIDLAEKVVPFVGKIQVRVARYEWGERSATNPNEESP